MAHRSLVALSLLAACSSPSGGGSNPGDDAPGSDAGVDAATDAATDASIEDDAAAPPVDGPVGATCPAGTWCVETAPIPATTILRAVDVVDASTVFAVGDGGVIIRRTNGAWATMTSGTTQNLYGVWAASATDAWAVGSAGTVLRWNGTTWSQMASAPMSDYNGVWGASANRVVLIGTASVRTWDGTSWSAKTIVGSPNTVHGTSATDVWVAAEIGGLNHYTGSWGTVTTGAGSTLFAAYAITPTDVWVSAQQAQTAHFDGTSWTTKASSNAVFNDFYASASTDVWGVFQTVVGHWNGTAWAVATPPGNTGNLNAVDGTGSHLWVVGSKATILHRD